MGLFLPIILILLIGSTVVVATNPQIQQSIGTTIATTQASIASGGGTSSENIDVEEIRNWLGDQVNKLIPDEIKVTEPAKSDTPATTDTRTWAEQQWYGYGTGGGGGGISDEQPKEEPPVVDNPAPIPDDIEPPEPDLPPPPPPDIPPDTTAPAVSIQSPQDASTIILADGNLVVGGTSSDNIAVSAVDIRIDVSPYQPTTSLVGNWSTWTTTVIVASGQHTITARATDSSGVQAWHSITIVVNEPAPPPPPPPPPPNPTIDPFGIVMIKPDSTSRPDTWFMNMNNPNINRARFDVREDNTITKNADGSWKIKDTQIRMNLYNKNGYSASKIPTYDRDVLTKNGYMQDADDWKNVEITMFVKLNANAGTTYFSPYTRSGWHSHGTAPNGENIECEGTGVKPRIYDNGEVATVKEMWHNDGYAVRDRKDVTTDLDGRWIGMKVMIYDVPTGVKQELWINEGDDPGVLSNWRKVVDDIDSGGFGTTGDDINCLNAQPDQQILWGGPIVTYRWDNASDVDFKWLSAREIQP